LHQLEYLFRDIKITENKKKLIIKKIKKYILKESDNEDSCILCGKEAISVCTSCFFFEVFNIIKKMKFKKDEVEYLFSVFSFNGIQDNQSQPKGLKMQNLIDK
jgi:hypothetical protein